MEQPEADPQILVHSIGSEQATSFLLRERWLNISTACIRDRAPVKHPGGHAREDEEEEREELEVDVVVIFKKVLSNRKSNLEVGGQYTACLGVGDRLGGESALHDHLR